MGRQPLEVRKDKKVDSSPQLLSVEEDNWLLFSGKGSYKVHCFLFLSISHTQRPGRLPSHFPPWAPGALRN